MEYDIQVRRRDNQGNILENRLKELLNMNRSRQIKYSTYFRNRRYYKGVGK